MSTAPDAAKLEACPLCGGPMMFCGDVPAKDLGDTHDCHLLICQTCVYTVDFDSEVVRAAETFEEIRALVAAAWNRRAPVAQPLSDEQIISACYSYRHDFGLLEVKEQSSLIFQAKQWERAFSKERDIHRAASPAGAVGVLTDEHVAEVVSNFAIHWAGSGPIAPLVEKHGVKVGTKLYARPAVVPAGWKHLTDAEWVNIVNAPSVLDPMKDKEEAVREAVVLTGAKLREKNGAAAPQGDAK